LIWSRWSLQAVPLVDADHQRPARLQHEAGDVGILLGNVLLGVQQQHHDVGVEIDCSVLTTENFSMASNTLPRRRMPAVSISV
jgi:hypothetical protein